MERLVVDGSPTWTVYYAIPIHHQVVQLQHGQGKQGQGATLGSDLSVRETEQDFTALLQDALASTTSEQVTTPPVSVTATRPQL